MGTVLCRSLVMTSFIEDPSDSQVDISFRTSALTTLFGFRLTIDPSSEANTI